MSQRVISLNPDLKRLRDEGYEIEIRKGHLLTHHIPYVNSKREVAFGILVTPLGDMAGDKTAPPSTHVIHFKGEHPCDKQGNILAGIRHASGVTILAEGVDVDHSFSNKPPNGYQDYYEKVTAYCRIISAEAQAIDPAVSATTFKTIDSTDDPDTVFNYFDSNTSRAEIGAISAKLKGLKIAIVGVGGTGSYILDFMAKTEVGEIHLFDGDRFLSHNAFRSPGAPSIETLRKQEKKVAYHHQTYSNMHKRIVPHEFDLGDSNLEELAGMSFVFICMDKGESKKSIIGKLLEKKIAFIDVGIGILAVDGRLTGSARTTTVTANKFGHIETRIGFADDGVDLYATNIQIAEINAVNAALAVIKFKKLFGVYHDLQKEHHSVYEINLDSVINDEMVA